MEQIILWESHPARLLACQEAIQQALTNLGVRAVLIVQSEPPLISRNRLGDRLPVLEIQGVYWSLHPGKAFTAQEVSQLLRRLGISVSSANQ